MPNKFSAGINAMTKHSTNTPKSRRLMAGDYISVRFCGVHLRLSYEGGNAPYQVVCHDHDNAKRLDYERFETLGEAEKFFRLTKIKLYGTKQIGINQADLLEKLAKHSDGIPAKELPKWQLGIATNLRKKGLVALIDGKFKRIKNSYLGF